MTHENPLEHMPLEEVRLEDMEYLSPAEEWQPEGEPAEPQPPPILLQQERGYRVLARHRTVWSAEVEGRNALKCFVVRSKVHVGLAHESISNCVEEAMLFEGLLSMDLVPNRSRLADMLGYSRARITQILNLLKLPEEIQTSLLLTDDVSEFQLRPLVKMDDESKQLEMFEKLVEGKLSGREIASEAEAESVEVSTPLDDFDLPEEEAEAGEEEALVPEGGSFSPEALTARVHGMVRRMGTLRDTGWQERALRMGAGEDDLMFLVAVSELRKGMYRNARKALTEFLALNPEHAPAYYYMGRCCNLMGELEEAESYLRNAVELVPEYPDYLSELAIVLEKMSRSSEAAEHYRKAGEIRKLRTLGKREEG